MSLANLILESTPSPQARMSQTFEGGSLVIGRGDDADWQLDDPDMFLSRKHCVIAEVDGHLTATDASRGGTFIDGSEQPLGTGNATKLEDGMRLRMGDFVFRIDLAATSQPKAETQGIKANFTFADAAPPKSEENTKRPEDLPPPFDPFANSSAPKRNGSDTPAPPKPLDMEDPFGLDQPAQSSEKSAPSGNRFFDKPINAPIQQDEAPLAKPAAPKPPQPQAQPVNTDAPSDAAMRDALLKGMGLDPARNKTDDPLVQMEAIGEQYRYLVEGVMHLLRARASEKQQVRVAQTLISSADVNPLKFLATTDDAISMMLSDDRPGYLAAPAAINGAYRDLADHQVRTWKALQSALRRMIDQFDPKQIEAELADSGMMEALLAGGRSAQHWRAYEERYQDIARAAEDRFLGEVGENFRDAYEGNKEKHG